jgi:glycosyltransferase involved in cell wall biosynthesis
MRISIVIPTHNRDFLLGKTLSYLGRQDLGDTELEIVVVDDSSADSTAQIVSRFRNTIPLTEYIYHTREEEAEICVSRLRNLGIRKSSGKVITFLDCGMAVPPGFVNGIAEQYSSASNYILIHYMLGVFINPDKDDCSAIRELTPENILEISRKLMLDRSWADIREVYFNLVNDRLDGLTAPWTLGWSGALSAPRSLVEKIGGFDESFTGWGAEDVDFSLRLQQAGGTFLAVREFPALHLPHPTASLEEKKKSNVANMKMMHRKFYRFDTEMQYLYEGIYCLKILGLFERLRISAYVPQYPLSMLEQINADFLSGTRHSLLIGITDEVTASALPTTHMFVYSNRIWTSFKTLFPDRTIQFLCGCDTPFERKFFDVVIISDLFRLLDRQIREALLLEMSRISKTIIILYTEGFTPWMEVPKGWSWMNLPGIQDCLSKLGLRTSVRNIGDSSKIIQIDSSRNI